MADNKTITDEIVEDIAEKTGTSPKRAREVYDRVRSGLSETVEKSGHAIHDTYDKVADKSLNDIQAAVIRSVRRNPGQSLLIAAGVGFIAGLFLRSRR